MATTQGPRPRGTGTRSGPRLYRWTSAEYYRLGNLGFFRDRRVELIEGMIVEMAARNPPHCIALGLTDNALRASFGAGFYIRNQGSFDLGKWSQPEPDLMVLRGSPRDYAAHPTTALMVVEISDTTLRYDRGRKARLYAFAGVPDYWIVNVQDRQLEVHRDPRPDATNPHRSSYATVTIIPATGHASPLAAPGAVIAVADLLP